MKCVLDRARKYIAKCPAAISGQGGHNATFHVAAVLVHGFALSECDGLRLLREWNAGCQPPWSESELAHKIRSAANAQHAQPRGYLLDGEVLPSAKNSRLGPAAKPAFSPMVLKRVAAKVRYISDVNVFLRESTIANRQWSAFEFDGISSAAILRQLYPAGSGEKVLIFSDMKSQGQFLWEADRGEEISDADLPSGADGVWFLPQPVCGQFLENPRLSGKRSRRSEEAVTSWRYMVLESDKADADDWLRCLIQMPLRIVCICESGGRSIHALVRLDATSKADWDAKVAAMKPTLITLGADPGALSAVRLTRLPQAMRGEREQKLLYLNPATDGRPICGETLATKGVV